jgi:hypothetical protein
MKADGIILGLSIVVMAPASSWAQGRTPHITPMGPTLMLPPAAAPMVPPGRQRATLATDCLPDASGVELQRQ